MLPPSELTVDTVLRRADSRYSEAIGRAVQGPKPLRRKEIGGALPRSGAQKPAASRNGPGVPEAPLEARDTPREDLRRSRRCLRTARLDRAVSMPTVRNSVIVPR